MLGEKGHPPRAGAETGASEPSEHDSKSPGALALVSRTNLLAIGRAPESLPGLDNLDFFGSQLSTFTAFLWLGMSKEMAGNLIADGRTIDAGDHFVECEPEPGPSEQLVLGRRTRGSHADIYLLRDSVVSG